MKDEIKYFSHVARKQFENYYRHSYSLRAYIFCNILHPFIRMSCFFMLLCDLISIFYRKTTVDTCIKDYIDSNKTYVMISLEYF